MIKDVRYAVRTLLKQPGFALVAVVTLALGIGANTAIFSVIDAALLRSLPYKEPSRLVHLWETKRSRDFELREASYPDFQDWRAQSANVFEGVAGYARRQFTLYSEGEAVRTGGAAVTANFFDLLGVRTEVGRTFLGGEDAPDAERAAVIRHGLWQRRVGWGVDLHCRRSKRARRFGAEQHLLIEIRRAHGDSKVDRGMNGILLGRGPHDLQTGTRRRSLLRHRSSSETLGSISIPTS